MMMNVLKRLSALSLVAGFTMLTACGGNASTGNVTAANGASSSPPQRLRLHKMHR